MAVMTGRHSFICECNSLECTMQVEVPLDEATRIMRSGAVLIVAGCSHGPDSGDELLEHQTDFSLYRET